MNRWMKEHKIEIMSSIFGLAGGVAVFLLGKMSDNAPWFIWAVVGFVAALLVTVVFMMESIIV